MTTIAYRILKFERMTKKSIVVNHALFTSITFIKINSFAYKRFYRNTAFIISNLQKNCQNNRSFVFFLQFDKHDCINILASNISFGIQVKDQ